LAPCKTASQNSSLPRPLLQCPVSSSGCHKPNFNAYNLVLSCG
jgi:hypothetical protein